MLKYPAQLERDPAGGAFVVTFPGLPGGTQADTPQEAMEMASDCLATILSVYMDRGVDIPMPGRQRYKGGNIRLVGLPASAEAKIVLYAAMSKAGLQRADLARRLSWTKSQVDRLFDIGHASRLDQLEAAFRALHKRMTISVEEAA